MKSLLNLEITAAVDLFMDIADDIQKLVSDADILSAAKTGNPLLVGATAYKTQKTSCDTILNALKDGDEEITSVGTVSAIATVIFEVLGDKELQAFFTSIGKMTAKHGAITADAESKG